MRQQTALPHIFLFLRLKGIFYLAAFDKLSGRKDFQQLKQLFELLIAISRTCAK